MRRERRDEGWLVEHNVSHVECAANAVFSFLLQPWNAPRLTGQRCKENRTPRALGVLRGERLSLCAVIWALVWAMTRTGCLVPRNSRKKLPSKK